MGAALFWLHYAKVALVWANGLLCLALLVRAFRRERRVSLVLLLTGLVAMGVTVLLGNAFVTHEAFEQVPERAAHLSDMYFQAFFFAMLGCCLGLAGELLSFWLRRRRTADE